MLPDAVMETKLLNEFRKSITDLDTVVEDAELKRFLKARNYDIPKAEEMLRKSIAWRKSVKFDEALSWNIPEMIHKSFPFYKDGCDKDGRMVFYFPAGRWEVRKMITSGWKRDMEQMIYYTMASLLKAVEETGWEKFVILIDLAEMTYWKIAHYETMQIILQVFREYEQNFPERLHSAVVINAPWVLNCIFPVIKPLLTGTTMDRVQIFDSSPNKYLPSILERVPKNGLPAKFREYNNNHLIED